MNNFLEYIASIFYFLYDKISPVRRKINKLDKERQLYTKKKS